MHDSELGAVLQYWNERLEAFRKRVGSFAFEIVHEEVGRESVETFVRDGAEVHLFPGFTVSDHRDWAEQAKGRPWFRARLMVPAEGPVGEPECDYDRPPEATRLRTPGHYVADLTLCPRPPELVPGWMKVELAAVGAWDLRADKPTWKDFESTGQPQTPESVGVPPPSGAEWALGAGPTQTSGPTVGDERTGSWTTPAAMVSADSMSALGARWRRMAERRSPVIQVLAPEAGVVPGEESVGIAPALAEVVRALPGVAIGGVVLDWPQGASQTWPELGERHTFQPVWAEGREAVVVRIDPETGEAGEVVHVRGDGDLGVIAGDIVSWWEALTGWAEQELVDLERELGPEAADEEELEMLLEESLDQDFQEWLQP
jgi:hypothetical protein